MPEITIRSARDADADALVRLAALDSSRVPGGDLLVAEVDGELVAAASDAGVIADPFRPTADVVQLLRLRGTVVRAPRGTARRPVRARLRLA
ncbi:MAG: hypothetical protein QOE86_3019 [Solirubrobacteraceae bacterium]|nr:hypothetical protein [Solirubrobacteraceae bacterium]